MRGVSTEFAAWRVKLVGVDTESAEIVVRVWGGLARFGVSVATLKHAARFVDEDIVVCLRTLGSEDEAANG